MSREVYRPVFDEAGIDVFDNEYGGDLEKVLHEANGVIVRSKTHIDGDFLDKYPNIKIVGRAGTGVDNIRVDEATERGVLVTNVPGGNTVSAVELTMAMMLGLARYLPILNAELRQGNWDVRSEYVGTELRGKILGIIGLGNIGGEVARLANAFGMEVIVNDPYKSKKKAEGLNVKYVEREELFKTADYITLHSALTDQTKDMINADQFEMMKEGVRIINCARGELINEVALLGALRSGKVAGAGLDVYAEEPIDADHPLFEFKNVITTPHSGASTQEAQERVARDVSQQVADYLLGNSIPRGAVNLPFIDSQLRPYLPLAEKLGVLASELYRGGELRLRMFGSLAKGDDDVLMRAFLKGYMSGQDPEVNMVNAIKRAQTSGINFYQERSSRGVDYSNLLSVEISEGDESHSIDMVLSEGVPCIFGINGYDIRFAPRGYVLFTEHRDVPGVVQHISGVLAENGVNIGSIVVARENGKAVGFVELDADIRDEVLEKIRYDSLGRTEKTPQGRIFDAKKIYFP